MFEGKKPFGDNKNAVEFFSFVEKELKNLIKSQRIAQKLFDRSYVLKDVKEDWTNAIHQKVEATELGDKEGSMAMFKMRYSTMLHECQSKMIDGIRSVCSEFNIELKQTGLKPTHDLNSEKAKVLKKYEMIQFVGGSWSNSWNHDFETNVKPQVINYINVIDVCGK